MPESLLAKLKALQRERTDSYPFPSHLEYQQWADAVSPLLAFNPELKRKFDSLVTTIQVSRPLSGSEQQEIINTNNLIGILNQAIALLENPMPKELKPLQHPDKITLQWVFQNAAISFYVWFFGLLGLAASLGFGVGKWQASISAATQTPNLSTATPAAPPKIPANAAPTAIENIKPKETPAQANSNITPSPQ